VYGDECAAMVGSSVKVTEFVPAVSAPFSQRFHCEDKLRAYLWPKGAGRLALCDEKVQSVGAEWQKH